jgi:hypothetical protein
LYSPFKCSRLIITFACSASSPAEITAPASAECTVSKNQSNSGRSPADVKAPVTCSIVL